MGGDIEIDSPNANIDVKGPNADFDADGKLKGKGGIDINMPDIKMPTFGFGGKGKKSAGDFDADLNMGGDIKTDSPNANIDVKGPDADFDADGKMKGKGGFDINMP